MNTPDKIKQLEEQLAALRKEVENKFAAQDAWPDTKSANCRQSCLDELIKQAQELKMGCE